MKHAFIFDLDGVITDTAMLHYEAWQKITRKTGIELDISVNERVKGLSRMDTLEMILRLHNPHNTLSVHDKERLTIAKNQYYQQLITNLTTKNILPGMEVLLMQLKQKGYPLDIASASQNAPAILKALQLDTLFDVIANPALIARGKPAPDIFLLAAEKLNIKPAICVGIEDAVSGVRAIKAAGMFAIGVGDKDILAEADVIVESTNELTFEYIMHVLKSAI